MSSTPLKTAHPLLTSTGAGIATGWQGLCLPHRTVHDHFEKALSDAVVKSITIKIKPGSKTTGLALVEPCGRVLFAAELSHRGQVIKAALG